MSSLERELKAFANKRRLAIIKFLNTKTEASVGEIADHIHLSFKATSKHLSILAAVEIVDKEQKSKTVCYRLSSPRSELLTKIILSL